MSSKVKGNRINQQGAVPCSIVYRGNTVVRSTTINGYMNEYSVHSPY